ncbi:288_t:CDS:10 [Funneliformis caledonium]|uniref:Nuclear pore complex protein n=1 Tax=Funneliformis caledonium TaxID=1117310 RepID=A0A9N8VX15_9GLOM|nr:288_t:CDS:10 [Funneliformis caledonium]
MDQSTPMIVDSMSTPRVYSNASRFQGTAEFTPSIYATPQVHSSDMLVNGFPSIMNSSITNLGTRLLNTDGMYFGNDIIQRYAEVYEHTRPQEDIGNAPETYEQMCEEYSKSFREEGGGIFNFKPRECRLWEAERNTWKLLKLLSQYRFTPIKSLDGTRNPFQTDGQLLCELLAIDKDFAEAWIVRKWLWKIAPDFITVETNPEYRSFTKNSILLDLKKRDSEEYKYLDPDGTHRTQKPLHPYDQEHEKELVRSIFEYLRRGQFDDAIDISDKNGHYWRSAILSGIILYDEKVDGLHISKIGCKFQAVNTDRVTSNENGNVTTIGNVNRQIWRGTCYHCANQEKLDVYDRAIYGVLSGNYESIIPICRTWEDYVWAYYNSLIECQQEEHARHMGVNDDDDLPINIKVLTPKEIFELVESKRVDSRDFDLEKFHIIQKLIILNDSKEMVKQLKVEIIDKRLRREDEIAYVHFLRLATHLILYLRDLMLSTPDKESDDIIKLYTELLIECHQNKLIALYASKLPREISIEIYASFLKGVTSSCTERRKLFTLAEQYGLNVVAITRKTFELIFKEIESPDRYGPVSDIRIITLQEPVNAVEEIQIRALEWLTFSKEQHREALKSANALCRIFLASGRMNVAGKIIMEMKYTKSPLSAIRYVKPDDDEDEIDTVFIEHQNYCTMIEYYNKYEAWWKTWKSKPEKPSSKELNEWTKNIKDITNSLDIRFHKFLDSYVIDFLRDTKTMVTEEDEIRIRELERVMDIYIPNAVLRHHKVLYETRDILPANLEESFNLANLVVEENADLTIHFRRSKKLPLLIMSLRDSYLEILKKNPKDISNVLHVD